MKFYTKLVPKSDKTIFTNSLTIPSEQSQMNNNNNARLHTKKNNQDIYKSYNYKLSQL